MIVALVPFVFVGRRHRGARAIGALVLANGALCHGASALGWRHFGRCRQWDVACNVLLCLGVLLATARPRATLVAIAIAAAVWRSNQRRCAPEDDALRTALHVVGVQWVLLWAFGVLAG